MTGTLAQRRAELDNLPKSELIDWVIRTENTIADLTRTIEHAYTDLP